MKGSLRTTRVPSFVVAIEVTRVDFGFFPVDVSHKFVVDIVVFHSVGEKLVIYSVRN